MKKRSLIAFLLALTMAFSLAACDNKTNDEPTTNPDPGQITEKTGYKVAYCTKRWSGSEHWMTVRNGVDGAIRPEDEYFFIDCNGDLDTQVKALEDLVAQGVDAIICAPRDPDGVVAAYEMIHNAGIKLISLDCSSSAPEFEDACVKMDYVSTGKLCAENLLEKIDYKGKVILYYDFPNVEANERADGFKEVAAQYPDVELVLVDGFGTVDEALLKLEDALIANLRSPRLPSPCSRACRWIASSPVSTAPALRSKTSVLAVLSVVLLSSPRPWVPRRSKSCMTFWTARPSRTRRSVWRPNGSTRATSKSLQQRWASDNSPNVPPESARRLWRYLIKHIEDGGETTDAANKLSVYEGY